MLHFSREELAERRARACAALTARGLDGLLTIGATPLLRAVMSSTRPMPAASEQCALRTNVEVPNTLAFPSRYKAPDTASTQTAIP